MVGADAHSWQEAKRQTTPTEIARRTFEVHRRYPPKAPALNKGEMKFLFCQSSAIVSQGESSRLLFFPSYQLVPDSGKGSHLEDHSISTTSSQYISTSQRLIIAWRHCSDHMVCKPRGGCHFIGSATFLLSESRYGPGLSSVLPAASLFSQKSRGLLASFTVLLGMKWV